MSVISSGAPVPAVPAAVAGFDVNFCKNPTCANFGLPADLIKWGRRSKVGAPAAPGKAYSLTGTGKSRPALKCHLCGEIFSVKSNLAVAEEAHRFAKYLYPQDPACCPNRTCAQHTVPVDTVKRTEELIQKLNENAELK